MPNRLLNRAEDDSRLLRLIVQWHPIPLYIDKIDAIFVRSEYYFQVDLWQSQYLELTNLNLVA